MKASKIRRARLLIKWRRWRGRYLLNEESLTKIQKAGLRVIGGMLSDRESCTLEHCPITNKRIATRGSDAAVFDRGGAAFAGTGYYYVVTYPAATYEVILRDFDAELKKRLASKHRRILARVETQIATLFAAADANEPANDHA